MGREYLNAGTLLAPLPPALVSVGVGERANLITIGWTGILSTIPPSTYISVRPSRHSHAILKEHGEFVIHLCSHDMAPAVDYAGIYTGAKVDKWQSLGLTKEKSRHVSVPTVAEAPIAIECRVREVLPMGSHDVFLADILGVSVKEELLDEEGKLHMERAGLLAYMHGEYYTLGEKVGRFGYSATKPERGGVKGSAALGKSKRTTSEKDLASGIGTDGASKDGARPCPSFEGKGASTHAKASAGETKKDPPSDAPKGYQRRGVKPVKKKKTVKPPPFAASKKKK